MADIDTTSRQSAIHPFRTICRPHVENVESEAHCNVQPYLVPFFELFDVEEYRNLEVEVRVLKVIKMAPFDRSIRVPNRLRL